MLSDLRYRRRFTTASCPAGRLPRAVYSEQRREFGEGSIYLDTRNFGIRRINRARRKERRFLTSSGCTTCKHKNRRHRPLRMTRPESGERRESLSVATLQCVELASLTVSLTELFHCVSHCDSYSDSYSKFHYVSHYELHYEPHYEPSKSHYKPSLCTMYALWASSRAWIGARWLCKLQNSLGLFRTFRTLQNFTATSSGY